MSRLPDTAKLAIVVAADRKGAIGRRNALPWHLPDDLKRFKALTLECPNMLMGRKTFDSIGRALPSRFTFILTHDESWNVTATLRVSSVDQAIRAAGATGLVVVGGGEVYAQTIMHPRLSHIYLTRVDTEVTDADAWFPALDPMTWAEVSREHHLADARHAYAFDFIDYRRR